jgi:DNA-directed RNA polymerase subunit RPC12/RpoP
MNEQKIMYKCGICGSEFQFGAHAYNGKSIARYKLMVCKNCWNVNWDGWNDEAEEKILTHLNENNIPIPKRNENGRLPRE